MSSGQTQPHTYGNSIFEFIDEKARQFPLIVSISERTTIQPGVLVSAVVMFLFVSLVFGWAGALICNIVGFVYPAWMSFKAVESSNKDDDRLWLTYWVVYAFFTIVEYFVEWILFWIPLYYLLKIAFLMYLCLPWFRGAEVVYVRFIRPLLKKHQSVIEEAVDSIGAVGTAAAEGVTSIVNDGLGFVQHAARNRPVRNMERYSNYD